MSSNESEIQNERGETTSESADYLVWSMGGYSYTWDVLAEFASRFKIYYTLEITLLSHFKQYLRIHQKEIPWYPDGYQYDPDEFVVAYADQRAPGRISFIIGLQKGVTRLSYRFKPDENDELIRKTCASMFGLPENPPFRTVIDPWCKVYDLAPELRELPEWYSASQDSV